jgi:CRP-like cAMP-binding protein
MPQSQSTAKKPQNNQRDRAILGLTRSCGLQDEGARALRSVASPTERYPAATLITPAGSTPRPKLILSGWACELRTIEDGRRQIFSFALAGDAVVSRPASAAHSCVLMALTAVECIDVERTLSGAQDPGRQDLARAIEQSLQVARERRYTQAVRLGRRSAVERVGDLLLELYDRLQMVDLVEAGGFPIALTQEHLADALGLSTVHVNRRLRTLRTRKLATLRFGRVSGFDREGLAALAR